MKHYVLTVNQTEVQFNEGELFVVDQKLFEVDECDTYDLYLRKLQVVDDQARISFENFDIYSRTLYKKDIVGLYCVEDRKKFGDDLAEIAKLNDL